MMDEWKKQEEQLQGNAHYQEYLKVRSLFTQICEVDNPVKNDDYKIQVYLDTLYRLNHIEDNDFMAKLMSYEFDLYFTLPDRPAKIDTLLSHHTLRRIPHANEMLEAMQKSRLGMYEVIARDDATGIVTFKDVYNKKTIEVTDTHIMPSMGAPLILLTRIVTFEGISFLSNFAMPFLSNKKVRNFIRQEKDIFKEGRADEIMLDGYNLYREVGEKLQTFVFNPATNNMEMVDEEE